MKQKNKIWIWIIIGVIIFAIAANIFISDLNTILQSVISNAPTPSGNGFSSGGLA